MQEEGIIKVEGSVVVTTMSTVGHRGSQSVDKVLGLTIFHNDEASR